MLVIGIICMIFAQLLHAGQCVLEEYILKAGGGQEPCYMMGWEGVFGVILTSIALFLAQFSGCPFSEK